MTLCWNAARKRSTCTGGFMALFLSAISMVRVPHANSRSEYKECLLYFGKSRDSGLFACSLCAADVSPWLWKWDCALFTIGVYQFQYFWMSYGILAWPFHNFLRLGFISFSKALDRRFDGLAWGGFNCDIRFPSASNSLREAIFSKENSRTNVLIWSIIFKRYFIFSTEYVLCLL